MKKIKESSKPITKEEIKNIEDKVKIKFPEEIINFYLKHNGGIMADNRDIYIDEINDIDVTLKLFLPMKYKRSDEDVLFEEFYEKIVLEKQLIPINYLPFAIDYGGNPYCINLNDGKVYIGYLEDYDGTPESTIRFISNDLLEFIDGMRTEEEAYN